MDENWIAKIILDCAFKVHRTLGPGLLESMYEASLEYELKKTGLNVERQKGMACEYCGVVLDVAFRVDLLVENKVIAEIKSVQNVAPIFKKILLSYLRNSGKRLGLLINFNEILLKNGISRVVNGL